MRSSSQIKLQADLKESYRQTGFKFLVLLECNCVRYMSAVIFVQNARIYMWFQHSSSHSKITEATQNNQIWKYHRDYASNHDGPPATLKETSNNLSSRLGDEVSEVVATYLFSHFCGVVNIS